MPGSCSRTYPAPLPSASTIREQARSYRKALPQGFEHFFANLPCIFSMPQRHRFFTISLKCTNGAACSDPAKPYSPESYFNNENNHFKS